MYGLDSYEEYVDLDCLQSITLEWAYGAAKKGKTMINKNDLAEFLAIFEAGIFPANNQWSRALLCVYRKSSLPISIMEGL
ncbi:MAG: hypothetical protein WA667_10060 [Candidatus Nitrosopolaris sp.]